MDSRSFTFLFAVFSLAVIRLAMYLAKRRGHLFLELAGGEFLNWRPSQLVLASFLTLFAEFAFIRWIAVEVHVFAYFKNLALLLCFVGFGLGCALAEKKPQWIGALTAFLGLPLLVRLPAKDGAPLEALSQNLGGAADVSLWVQGSVWNWMHFLTAAALAGVIFLLIVWIFVPLGQIVSRHMNFAPSAFD